MSNATAAKKRPFEFDDALLQDMADPITLHVEHIIGGRPVPHILPVKPGQTSAGAGWNKEEVKSLAEYILSHAVQHNDYGLYYCTATDESGKKMKWQIYAPPPPLSAVQPPPQEAPVSVLATPLAGAQFYAQQPQPPQAWLHAQQPQYQGGIPGGYQGPLQPQAFNAQQAAQAQFAAGAAQATQVRSVAETDKIREEREARLALQAQIDRERLENRYKEQLGTVSAEMRQLQESIRGNGHESVQMAAMREQLEAQRRANEQNQLLQMMERQRADTAATIAAIQAATKDQITAVQAQIAALASKPAGPDPAIMMMIESMKTSAQQQMQMFQMQQTQQQQFFQMQVEAQKQQMGPKEWIELSRSSNQTADQLSSAYSKVHELMMTSVETILQSQGPQMHPALQMLGEGVQGALAIGQKVVEDRSTLAQQQVQVAAHQANANMALAHELERTRVAGQQARLPAGGGPQIADDAPDDDEDDEDDEDAPPSDNVILSGHVSPDVLAAQKKREKESFGDAYEHIKRLRAGVRSGVLDDKKAALAIVQGVDNLMSDPTKTVPVFQLWVNGQIAELVDQLLPEAKESFRGKIVDHIMTMAKQLRKQNAVKSAAIASGEVPVPQAQRAKKPRPVAAASPS